MALCQPLRSNTYCCLRCSGFDHLATLPSGDAALTRRASRVCSEVRIIVAWNARRKRWERRGTLVTPDALAHAQAECALDEEKRAAARQKAQARDAVREAQYLQQFTRAILEQYPGLAAETAETIARHACEKYSGRVGRSAGAKQFDPDLITRAVIAHARHLHTDYDALRDAGLNKRDSRAFIRKRIKALLATWRRPSDTMVPPAAAPAGE